MNHDSPLKLVGLPKRVTRSFSEPTKMRCIIGPQRNTPAKAAGVSVETVKRLEGQDGPLMSGRAATIDAIEKALIKAGIEFTNGDEPGVKLRAKKKR